MSAFSDNINLFRTKLSKVHAAAEAAVAEVRSIIERDLHAKYSREADPYGRSWAPRVGGKNDDGHPLLNKSGALKSSLSVSVNDDGSLDISYDDPKATYHQKGTSRMPQRLLVPSAKDIPPEWRTAFNKVYADKLNRLFGRGS